MRPSMSKSCDRALHTRHVAALWTTEHRRQCSPFHFALSRRHRMGAETGVDAQSITTSTAYERRSVPLQVADAGKHRRRVEVELTEHIHGARGHARDRALGDA